MVTGIPYLGNCQSLCELLSLSPDLVVNNYNNVFASSGCHDGSMVQNYLLIHAPEVPLLTLYPDLTYSSDFSCIAYLAAFYPILQCSFSDYSSYSSPSFFSVSAMPK